MVFSSFGFIFIFLPLLFIAYFIVPSWQRSGRNVVLLFFSLLFYFFGGPRFFPLILLSVAINHFGGLLAGGRSRYRRLFLVAATVLNLSLLFWFKYASFAAENLSTLGFSLKLPDVVLPIGISFFTFQGLSYVFDVYRGDAPIQRNPLKTGLYIMLFPQLVAGPIIRYASIADQIDRRTESLTGFADGAVRFLFGLSKKMLLANQLGVIADEVFSAAPGSLTVTLSWLGALSYTGQIYFDFSAYSDMAIGLGRIFGFRFPENFNYPYISRSVTEFWRRWHMTLSGWFRDYVYIPLGGSRGQLFETVRNMLIVWLLTGFWHGAAWTFLLWGFYFGVLLLGERTIWGKLLNRLPSPLQHLYTMVLIVFGWVFFRSGSVAHAASYFSSLFGGSERGFWDGQTLYFLLEYRWELLIGILAALPVKDRIQTFLSVRAHHPSAKFLLTFGKTGLALLLFALSFLRLLSSGYNPFIYFRF